MFAGDDAGEELRACLAQEVVLRDVPVDPAWYASHPDLGALPPARTEVERGRRTAAPPPAPGPAAPSRH